MKHLFLAMALISCSAEPVLAGDLPCDQPDVLHPDTDGMPFCPPVVANQSAFAVYRCALADAKSFHKTTPAEKASTKDLIAGFKADSVPQILGAADKLGLQACRVKSADDSYLLVYTKPGVKDYSGAFYMFREKGASKVIIVSPHDDSDETFQDTKIGLAKSKAMMTISNGHRRSNGDGLGDFVHDPCGENLGCIGTGFVGDMWPGSVWLHVHGMVNPKVVLYRGRSPVFNRAYEKAIKDNTNIDTLNPNFNADFSIDKVVNTDFYIKTEIPVRIHKANPLVIAKIVTEIETNDWAWPGSKQAFVHPQSSPAPAAKPISWDGPLKDPHSGTPSLTCVVMTYSDGFHQTDPAKCLENAKMVANFYDRNSRGLLKFQPVTKSVKAPYPVAQATIGKDLGVMKSQVKSNYYILAHKRYDAKDESHAGSKTAFIMGSLIWDSSHEVGHLIGLGHAGKYHDDGTYGKYDDHYESCSVMSDQQCNLLTSPQYFHEGWVPVDEALVYDPGVKEYTLKRLNAFSAKGVMMVLVNPIFIGNGRAGFISYVDGCKQGCIAYHLSDGGGSARVATFGDDYLDPNGLHIHVTSLDGVTAKITVETKK